MTGPHHMPTADDTPLQDLPDVDAMARTCLGLSVRRTSNLITRHYNAHLASAGLEVTQFSLLAGIASRNPASLGDLASFLSIDRSTLTRNLKPLQAAGLIVMAPGAGRRQLPALTDAGRAALFAAAAAWQTAQSSLLAELGPDDTGAVRAGLKRLRDALRALSTASPARPE